MGRIFDMENPFWTFLNKLADVVIWELLWLLTSIPLFTIGASSSAFWYCVLHLARDEEGKAVSGYFRAFKAGFRTGTAVWLTWLAAFLFLLFDMWICSQMGTVFSVFIIGILLALTAALLLISMYLFAVAGNFRFTWTKVIKDSAFMTIRHLPYSVAMLVLIAAAFVGSYYVPYAIIALPALAFYIDARVLNMIFDKYVEKDDDPDELPELRIFAEEDAKQEADEQNDARIY